MGASNFSVGNASKVFAVLMNTEEKYSECLECGEKAYEYFDYVEVGGTCYECGSTDIKHDTEYRSCEDFEVDDLKSYINELAQQKQGKFRYSEENGSDNDRNYCASYLFSFYFSKSFGDIEVECKITAKMVGAYYEGASLDWDFEIYNGGEWSEVCDGYYTITEKDIVEDLFGNNCSCMNQGLLKMLSKYATKFAEKTKTEMVDLVEQIFTEVSNPLQVVARFSNGETIYSKAV